MQNVFITGGLGYMGGRFAQQLGADGFDVSVSTRRPPGVWPAWTAGVRVCRFDLANGDGLDAALEGVDTVIHLAAMNSTECAEDPEQAVRTNVGGTLRLARAAANAGARRLIYISTIHVYGSPLIGRLDEQTLPRPTHPYSWTHRAAEDIVLGARGLRGIVLRVSNAVGAPRDTAANCWMLITNDLCREAVVEGTLTLRGSGRDARDFLPLPDVIDATRHVAELDDAGLGERLFNVGAGATCTTRQIAERIAVACDGVIGRRPTLSFDEAAGVGTPPGFDFRIDRLAATGFSPANRLDAALEEILQFCTDQFSPLAEATSR